MYFITVTVCLHSAIFVVMLIALLCVHLVMDLVGDNTHSNGNDEQYDK